MILLDANVLIYAFRRDAERHEEYREWLENVLCHKAAVGLADVALAAVIRITTHPKIFAKPSSMDEAFIYTSFLMGQPNVVHVHPGPRHWGIFEQLCRKADARGNLVTDAYLAALAIESGAEMMTTDRDFARFPGLRWRHPLA